MTHIGIDARLTAYRVGGISTYIRELVAALARLQPTPNVTVFESRKAHENINNDFTKGMLWTPAHHKLERLALSVEVGWRGLDVWHSPDFIPPYRAAKRHIITVHDLTFLHYPQYLTPDSSRYYNDQIAAACHHADHILAVSHATAVDLQEMLGVLAHKITVQPHGVHARYHPLPPSETNPVLAALDLPSEYILHVGTLEPRKNLVGLVRAYKQVLSELPDAPPIVLVGRKGWFFEQLWDEIMAIAPQERIFWRKTVTDEQLPAVYNRALVNVTVSHYEGFGMPAAEGMACGTVPIVSNRSSLPEVVGDVGLRVNPDDPDEIAAALVKALTDDDWLQKQEQAAIRRAAQFSWERSAQIALQTYTAEN